MPSSPMESINPCVYLYKRMHICVIIPPLAYTNVQYMIQELYIYNVCNILYKHTISKKRKKKNSSPVVCELQCTLANYITRTTKINIEIN